jgi:TRAP transporter 4TM/12TM fusion protein
MKELSPMNRLTPFWKAIVFIMTLIGVLLAINQVFYLKAFGFNPIDNAYLYYILASFLPLAFLIFPIKKSLKTNGVPWYDIVLFLFSLVVAVYFGLNGEKIITMGWEYTAPMLPTVFSVALWVLTLEGLRRSAGLAVTIVALVFSLYPLFADKVPVYFLQGQHFDFLTTARNHAMSANSIVGIPFQTVGSLLVGFLVFGVVLQHTGGANFFFNLAQSLFGRSRGGSAKVCVMSSAFMGMMSGSAVSNVLTAGAMTIPAMKKSGYTARYAAGIEATASTGGTITPPIMGSAAFIMASLLAVPYAQIALAAAIPALLYYFGLMVQVDGFAAKNNLVGLTKEQIPSILSTLKSGWFYILSLVALIYLLTVLRSEGQAPFYAILVLLIVTILDKEHRLTWKGFVGMIVESGRTLAEISAIIAGVGLIVGGLSITGVSFSFSRELVAAVGDNVLLILIAGAITCFILGMGMTVSAVYVFLAIVMVPALVNMGINAIAAHLFVIYWAAVSYITPPVALAAFAAAGIAGSDPMKTGFTAMKLGVVKYIIPFLFVYNPALVAQSSFSDVLYSLLTGIVGVFAMASGLEGWLNGYGRVSNWLLRIALVVGGICLMIPETYTDIVGAIIIIAFFVAGYIKRSKNKGNSPSTQSAN